MSKLISFRNTKPTSSYLFLATSTTCISSARDKVIQKSRARIIESRRLGLGFENNSQVFVCLHTFFWLIRFIYFYISIVTVMYFFIIIIIYLGPPEGYQFLCVWLKHQVGSQVCLFATITRYKGILIGD